MLKQVGLMETPHQPVEPIAPEAAAVILAPKLAELEAEGWVVLVQTDYMARLTRGKSNLDVRVDLLGQLELEEKPLTLPQESGRIIATLFLIIFFLLALVLASGLGVLD
ncbi:MAG: hypothetical protein HC915_05225 [Anaerolineae bacterium]|nr:hypothetical protein [Anaerolineae bacterium]